MKADWFNVKIVKVNEAKSLHSATCKQCKELLQIAEKSQSEYVLISECWHIIGIIPKRNKNEV
jgi:hypothetical protein